VSRQTLHVWLRVCRVGSGRAVGQLACSRRRAIELPPRRHVSQIESSNIPHASAGSVVTPAHGRCRGIPGLPAGSARDAQGAWRLAAVGPRRRVEEAAEGTVEAWGRSPGNPVGRLVRAQEGAAWPVRQRHASGPGGARTRRLSRSSCNNRMRAIEVADRGWIRDRVIPRPAGKTGGRRRCARRGLPLVGGGPFPRQRQGAGHAQARAGCDDRGTVAGEPRPWVAWRYPLPRRRRWRSTSSG
jgi:hypothetical protein